MSYLLLPDHRIVLVSDPKRVCGFLPTARPLNYKGRELAAVPFRLGEVAALRQHGVEVPSPIGYTYNYPGRFPALHHQKDTAGFATLHPRGYVLNEMGTMKTLSLLWAADYLMRERIIRRALIVSPLSTLNRVWGDEIFFNFPDRTFAVLHGAANRRLKLLAQHHDFYIVNFEGVDIIRKAALARKDIGLIIIDELALGYRNARPDRYKAMEELIQPWHWVWGATGAPMPHSATDAWAQCRLITPHTVPKYFSHFRNMVQTKLSAFKWKDREEAKQIVYNAMQPAIRYRRDQCVDLPPTVIQTREADLTTEQRKLYKEMADKLRLEFAQGKVTAANAGVLALRLLQIAAGVVYDVNGQHIMLDCSRRLETVKEIIESAESKIIVFASFTGVVHMLHRELSKLWPTAMVYGGVSQNARSEIFAAFQRTATPRILVADPGTMSHGLTLTEANTMIWYGPPRSNDIYRQGNARITRSGQRFQANIVNIVSTRLESKRYKLFDSQESFQDTVLQMVERGEEL